MTTLNFTDVDVPETTRQSEPNPFEGVFPRDDKAISVTLPGQESDKDDNGKAIRVLIKRARTAAHAVDRSVRVKHNVRTEGTGKNAKTVTDLTFWTTPKITRERKNGDTAEATAE